MECKKCGAVAPENATFCPSCGERVDGKKVCARCGTENDENYKFCVRCGARMDGKSTCKQCGAEYEGNFCPACGVKSVSAQPTKKQKNVHSGKTSSNVLRIVSLSFGLLAALSAFVFMFFIGFKGEKTVFYYFWESFKELKEVNAMAGGLYYGSAIKTLAYTSAIADCVIAAATLASVALFFVLTVVRSIKAFCGKETRSPLAMAVWTAMCYILGTFLLYPFDGGVLDGVKFEYNGGTLAGLIVCFVGLVTAVTCALLSDLEKFKSKSFVVRLICTGACIVMGTVALFMVRNAGMRVALNMQAFGVSENLVGKGSPGAMGTFLFAILTALGFGDSKYKQLNFEMHMTMVFSLLGTLFVLAAIVCTVLALCKNVRSCTDKKVKGNGLLLSIVAAICAVGALAFSIALARQVKFIIESTNNDMANLYALRMGFALSILAVIFSFVYMGITIAAKIVSEHFDTKDNE